MAAANYWVVTVPNEESKSEAKYAQLQEETSSARNDLAELYRFNVPTGLLVGTLDSLISLSDDLNRVDLLVESVVKKVERQFGELAAADDSLAVEGVPTDRYLHRFSWDEAKYPQRRPLPELVGLISTSMGKVDEELKQLTSNLGDKVSALNAYSRKKGGSAMVAPLDDLLTPEVVSADMFVNTEYLTTLVAVVPKALEQEWLSSYESLSADLVSYPPPEGAGAAASGDQGSPVVPGSGRKLVDAGDQALYAVTVLKGQFTPGYYDEDGQFQQGGFIDFVQPFVADARERRFIMREFEFDPDRVRAAQDAQAQLEVEVNHLRGGLVRWCRAHYGEAFTAFIHLKAIRVFVESVLRYGLPLNFTSVLFRPRGAAAEKRLTQTLTRMFAHVAGANLMAGGGDDADEAGNAAGVTGEFHPFVVTKFGVTLH